MNEEIWKDIPNYEGMYQVSSIGRVKSFKGKSERILKPGTDSSGYLMVNLYKDTKVKSITVHKLIQLAFKLCTGICDHISGDILDNRIENLRVGTMRDNSRNLKIHREGKLVGATYMKRTPALTHPWQSRIYLNGKQEHLGCFPTEQEAHDRYKLALSRLEAGETDRDKI